MSKFLVFFLLSYSAMHALFYFRIRVLLPDRRLIQALFVLFLVLMIIAPLLCHLLERNGNEMLARYMAIIGFNWTGFIFLSFCAVLLMQIMDLCFWGLNRFFRLNITLLAGKLPALVLIVIVVLLSIYGYFQSRAIKIEPLLMETNKLPPETDRLKIVQISDVHLGLLSGSSLLNKISKKVQFLKPDILVCTGDLIDGLSGHLPENSNFLNQIDAPFGKYAVTGNHEYYTGLDLALDFMKKSGFRVLRGEVVTINGLINIAGVDDAAWNEDIQEDRLLSSVKNGLFTLFLKHRPLVLDQSIGLFDLQLSGHTHGGQIFPFIYLVKLQYPLPIGYCELSRKSFLYTSRGTGTWGPQMRILSPPEITVVELVRKGVNAN